MQESVSKIKFSVIIPVYNTKDYIEECIESILNQTYTCFEIVLVDDGSTDGSSEICDRYAANNDKISVFHKKNEGQSSARNKGIELIQGDFFVFVDSDDYIAPNTLEMFDKVISKNLYVDVVLSECMFNVEPNGTVLDVQRHFNSGDFENMSGQQAILNMGMQWSPCGKCFKTSFWKKHNFTFVEGRISEDLQLIDRVTLEADKVSMIPGHYYYRWKIPSSTMHVDYEKLVEDTIFVLRDWNSYLMRKQFDPELDNAIRRRLAIMLEHTVMGNVYYVDKDARNGLVDEIYECINMIKYDTSVEGRAILLFVRIFGIDKTCHVLNWIKRHRKKKQSFV